MQTKIRELLDNLQSGLQVLYGTRLKGIFLFGSYARGEENSESDVDVLIVLDKVDCYGAEIDRTSHFIADFSLRYDVSVSRVFVSERDWLSSETPFLKKAWQEALAT